MKKTCFFTGLVSVVAWFLTAVVGLAAEKQVNQETPSPAPRSVFEKNDGDGDGQVSAREYGKRQAAWFAELDENRDGKLDADEYVGERFIRMDVNQDGSVTLEEYVVFFSGKAAKAGAKARKCGCVPANAKQPTFHKIDANQNGVATRKEMAAEAAHRFAQADKNKDGKLDENEFDEHGEVEFARWDLDQNGRLTHEEFMVARVPVKPIKTGGGAACPISTKADEKK